MTDTSIMTDIVLFWRTVFHCDNFFVDHSYVHNLTDFTYVPIELQNGLYKFYIYYTFTLHINIHYNNLILYTNSLLYDTNYDTLNFHSPTQSISIHGPVVVRSCRCPNLWYLTATPYPAGPTESIPDHGLPS